MEVYKCYYYRICTKFEVSQLGSVMMCTKSEVNIIQKSMFGSIKKYVLTAQEVVSNLPRQNYDRSNLEKHK